MQFKSQADIDAALKLTGQMLMGRELDVHPATEGGNDAAKLNLGAPVQDCWFCLSNEQVCRACKHLFLTCANVPANHISCICVTCSNAHACRRHPKMLFCR